MGKIWLSKTWRFPKVMLGLICFEFALTVACLALTGIASPDTYRSKLWKEGGELGLSSSPSTIIYAIANFKPVKTPMVWSAFHTRFNLVISVLSMFILLTKLTLFLTNTFRPIFAFLVHAILVALWAFSISIQTGHDTIDPRIKINGPPWYLTHGCSVARTTPLQGYCKQAKSVFAVSCICLALFSTWLVMALWSAFPTKEEKAARISKVMTSGTSTPATGTHEKSPAEQWQQQWEMGNIPATPMTAGMKMPMTPRTKAFNSLSGDLPLRNQYK